MASRKHAVLFAGLALVGASAVTGSGGAAQNTRAVIAVPRPYTVAAWRPETDNLVAARGTITSGGTPMPGVRVTVDGYVLPRPTDAQGHFTYLVDGTRMARHVVSVPSVPAAHAAITGAVARDSQVTQRV